MKSHDMTLRMELLVADLATAVNFYGRVLGFEAARVENDYAQLRNGSVVLGIGLSAALPPGHHFPQEAFQQQRGVGVEVVLEVDDVNAWYERVRREGYPIARPLAGRPWG